MKELPDALKAPRRTMSTRAGGEVSYYVDETAAGRPLVLLHSINAAPSAMEMKPLFERYRSTRPVIAPDLPGFGKSERADIDYSPALYADTVRELIAATCAQPPDVIALSTTAEFAARAALAGEPAFHSLVLLSPTGLGARKLPSARTSNRLRGVLRFARIGRGLFRMLTGKGVISFYLEKSFAGEPPAELVDYAYLTGHQPGARYAPFAFLSMRLFTADALEALYRPLGIPTLLLYDEDANVTFEYVPELVEANAHISEQRIAGTRGMPHWDRPEETFAAIDRFWTGIA